MRARPSDLRLDVLTRLGHRLPRTRSTQEAAAEVTSALSALHIASTVTAVESDMAFVIAVHVPQDLASGFSAGLASSLIGLRIPLDGVELLRQPVRLRRPYTGPADASETIRRLTTDSALAKVLPNAADEREVVAVPVTAGDRVLAVLSVWGPGCDASLVPVLEAVGAMLAAAWSMYGLPQPGRSRRRRQRRPISSCARRSRA